MLLVAVAAIAIAGAPATFGWAQATKGWKPDSRRGLHLAETLCAACHLIRSDGSGTVVEGVPSFRAIANRPGQTGERIASVLINPHAPMPRMQLTRREIGDLIAYLETFRDPATGAPLLKGGKPSGKKPVYPRPS